MFYKKCALYQSLVHIVYLWHWYLKLYSNLFLDKHDTAGVSGNVTLCNKYVLIIVVISR